MKSAFRLVLAILTIGCISALNIDWDVINGDPIKPSVHRPTPPKRPAPPAQPLPPVEDEFLPPNFNEVNSWENDVKIQINTLDESKQPALIGPTEVRPFEPRPTPPVYEEPQGPPGPPGPPGINVESNQNHKPKPPHHLELHINEPLLPYKPIDVNVKPLDVVDGVIVPTPKYPVHSRPQIEVFYEV